MIGIMYIIIFACGFGGMLREVYLGSAAQVRTQLTLHAMGPQRDRLRLLRWDQQRGQRDDDTTHAFPS